MKIEAKMLEREALVEEYGPRVCQVKTSKGNFLTPSRALSSQEARAYMKSSAVLSPLENRMYEHVATYSEAQFAELAKKNGALAKELVKINALKNLYADKITSFFPIRLSPSIHLDPEDMLSIIDLQNLSVLDLVSIPDYWKRDVSLDRILHKIENYTERVSRYGGSIAVPYVDTDREPEDFKKMVLSLLDRTYPIIGIEYSSITYHYPVFRELTKMAATKAENTIFHLSRVDPWVQRSIEPRASPLFYSFLFGIDSACAAFPARGGGGKRKVESVRRFSPSTSGMLVKPQYEAEGREAKQDCTCPLCKDKTVGAFFKEYSLKPTARQNQGKEDADYLAQICRVHEAFSSMTELEAIGRCVKKREFQEIYLKNHTDLQDAGARIPRK